MKKLIIFLASAALLTGYAQTSSQGGNGGSNSSGSNRSRFNSTVSTRSSGSGSTTATRTNTRSFSATSNTTSSGTNQLTFDDVFLRRAAADSLQEIELGGLAETNSQNTDVQNFGALLVTNHTASLAQAQELANTVGVTLPTALTTNQQQQVQRLSGLTGDAFDRAFISVIIQSHIQSIRLFEVAAILGKNADVRAYARDQLPILMNHLVTALQIREGLRTTQTAGATSNTRTSSTTRTRSSVSASGTGGGGSVSASASADP